MDVEICLDLTQESIEYSAIWQDCNVILYDYTTFIFYTFYTENSYGNSAGVTKCF